MLPPSLNWLNGEFLEKVLKKSENNETIHVKNYSMTFVNAIGDHYASDIIRASVEYSCDNPDGKTITKNKSLIIKVAPTLEDARKQCIAESGVFGIEIKMMETLVKMKELLGDKEHRLNARTLYTDNGNPPLLVLEDLNSLGYRMPDRQIGLDFDHCILAMRGLARFHASSVALYEKNPDVAKYTHGIFHTNITHQIKQSFENGFRIFADEILDWPELGSSGRIFSEKVLKLSDVFFEKGYECYAAKTGEFNVLNHGDCWSSNMLFRYNDEGQVCDHIFVDFQMCCWTTPLLDILTFMNTSIAEDVEMYHRDALFEEYLDCLTKTMIRIGCETKAPKMCDLRKILPEHEILSAMASCVGLPMIVHTKKVRSLDEVLRQSNDCDRDVFKRPEYRRRIIRRLQDWNANGVFDI